MSLSKYIAFVTAVQLGSFTKAADVLGYTQSGVSHLIRSLEDELGISLLSRSRNGIALTQEGKSLLPHIQSLIMAERVVYGIAEEFKRMQVGVLNVGSFASITLFYLPDILNKYQELYPGVKIQVMNSRYSTLENALLENRIDCAFVSFPSLDDFRVVPLCEDRLMAVIPEINPLSTKEALTAEDFAHEAFIMPAEGSNYSIGEFFSSKGIVPQTKFVSEDDYSAIEMVRRGMGITIMPELLLRHVPLQGIVTIPLQFIARKIGIATNRKRAISPITRTFIEITESVIKNFQQP